MQERRGHVGRRRRVAAHFRRLWLDHHKGWNESSDQANAAIAKLLSNRNMCKLCRMLMRGPRLIARDGTQRHQRLPLEIMARGRTPPLGPRQSWPGSIAPATALVAVLKWCGAGPAPTLAKKLELRSGRGKAPCWQPSTLVAAGRTAGSARINCCCRSAAIYRLGQPQAGKGSLGGG